MGAEGAETAPTRPSSGALILGFGSRLGPGNLGSHALLVDGGSIRDFAMENSLKMNDLEVPLFEESHYLYA